MPHWHALLAQVGSVLVAMTWKSASVGRALGKRFGRVGVAHFPHKAPLACIGSELDPEGSQTNGADFARERCFARLVLTRLPSALPTEALLLKHTNARQSKLARVLLRLLMHS